MVDALIGFGHPPQAIEGYTLKAMYSYLELAINRDVSRERMMALIMRSAYHADARQFTKTIAKMGGD